MLKAMRCTLMVIIGLLAVYHFGSMIGLLVAGKEVDTITLYILLGSCVVLSIRVTIESILCWFETLKGAN